MWAPGLAMALSESEVICSQVIATERLVAQVLGHSPPAASTSGSGSNEA
jgi:hypothetical protein